MKPNEMKPEEIEIIKAMAKCDLSTTNASRELHRHRNTVIDLVKLLEMVEG